METSLIVALNFGLTIVVVVILFCYSWDHVKICKRISAINRGQDDFTLRLADIQSHIENINSNIGFLKTNFKPEQLKDLRDAIYKLQTGQDTDNRTLNTLYINTAALAERLSKKKSKNKHKTKEKKNDRLNK